jgi:hypothetical protein
VYAEKQSPNINWIEKNLISIFDSLHIPAAVEQDSIIIQTGAVYGDEQTFIKGFVIKFLASRVSPDSQKKQVKIFHIEQFVTDIVYLQRSSGFLYLQTDIDRINNIKFTGWIEDKKGTVLQSIDIQRKFVEKSISGESGLEKSSYSFSRGKTVELSLWTQIVEPVIVVSALTTMAYLFFKVRS